MNNTDYPIGSDRPDAPWNAPEDRNCDMCGCSLIEAYYDKYHGDLGCDEYCPKCLKKVEINNWLSKVFHWFKVNPVQENEGDGHFTVLPNGIKIEIENDKLLMNPWVSEKDSEFWEWEPDTELNLLRVATGISDKGEFTAPVK